MSLLYPLRFKPILRRYLWGGRRLESLGKTLEPGDDYAESWEIVDRGGDSSTVTTGTLKGHSLGQIVREHPRELLGRHSPQARFPLLFKFLDANDRLSIQVHPDDARAAKLAPPDLGKTEAWVIIDAQPGSYLYAGLRDAIDRETLKREMARRTIELCIQRFEPKAGDCFFLPAGVVHGLGPGLLVAEIQQASDTTYRIHDWNRVGPDGQPRPLHVEAALEAIDYAHGPVRPAEGQAVAPGVERLVACDKFVLDRHTLTGPHAMGGDGGFHILAVLDGTLAVAGDPARHSLAQGGVVLLPAELGRVEVEAAQRAVVLDAYLP